MAWQKQIAQLVDAAKRKDDEATWTAAEIMYDELVQEEQEEPARALMIVGLIAHHGVKDDLDTIRKIAGVGPEWWGGVMRRMN